MLPAIIALVLGLEVPSDHGIIAPARALGPYQVGSHVMILRQKMDVDRIDHFRVAWRMILPVAIGFPIGRTVTEIINIGPKVKVQCDIRPSHAAPSQIYHHCRVNTHALCHEKCYRNLIRRQCAVANENELALGDLVVVPDCKVKAPEAITREVDSGVYLSSP
jgi:hypothetical protein